MPIPLDPTDAHDLRLESNVRPKDYQNPTAAKHYAMVVIGGGSAGLVSAAGAAGLGAKVALIERDLLGGDCLNVGCVPSKTFLRAAHAAHDSRTSAEWGIGSQITGIDESQIFERTRQIRADLSPNDSAERFTKLGVDVFLGAAHFTSPRTIEVGGQTLNFSRAVIATGAHAARPTVPGYEHLPTYTNENFFQLTTLPKRWLVVGGGPIGCELGQALARLGCQVQLLARDGRILPRDHPEAAELLAEQLRSEGIQILPKAPAVPAVDAVLLAAGRVPNVDSLGLESAKVQFDPERGIAVDEYLQTTNPRIYAAGDVCAHGFHFTHAADTAARLVVQNALFPLRAKFKTSSIPWCTFTDPEVAQIGSVPTDVPTRTSQTFRVDLSSLDRAVCDGASGFVEVQVKLGTDQILGATIVGPRAGELISIFSLAMAQNLGLKALGSAIIPYPTYADAIKKLADQFARTRLTPTTKWALSTWLKWMR